ncbi:MAG: TIGR03087 family PEP-CTERM/XrtA system glycosyltransferase [Acidobacteriaceae bacterium]|nr:TIGR03087 family PEP-CTERM/XrtA system glycosyltransferase [Acidobacteriaceae bacterium]
MFDSCSAYQTSKPQVLFLSHCVPNPPDKGEKIRAYHELKALTEDYDVHLACLARSADEVRDAQALLDCCASVHAELLRPRLALARAGAEFLTGACLNEAFYSNPALHRCVERLARKIPFQAAFVYTAVMAPYVPAGLPHVLDLVDVDSEKWTHYARIRRPSFLYGLEARRMRQFERLCAEKSAEAILTTDHEAAILRQFAPSARVASIENGVDTDYFDGQPRPLPNEQDACFLAFIGTMDYHPNVAAAVSFGREIFPELRRRVPELEFFIVGRNPSPAVLKLRNEPNIRVLGAVPDVRPYLSSAAAIVAPLDLARGVQNKVLEALAMGRKVFASDAVCRTFGADVPLGVIRCATSERFVAEILEECRREPVCDENIREAARVRFSWARNMQKINDKIAVVSGERAQVLV